jgi:antitoxin MazE
LPLPSHKIYNANVYQARLEGNMQVSKWGNSLAVRLPSEVVEALNLKEGDQIEITIADTREFEVRRDPARQRALERLRRLRRPLPAGFVFDRAEANAR